MGMKHSGRRGSARARQVEGLSNVSTIGGGARISRDFLLAGASLLALAAFAASDRALAACSGPNQTISSLERGTVRSNGGAIAVTTTGFVFAGSAVLGRPGVLVAPCPATTIDNNGTIRGGIGFNSFGNAVGGAAVSNSATIMNLTNSGAISGGTGLGFSNSAIGGAGAANAGTIRTLTNTGAISGGAGTADGGAGVSNSGKITTLINGGGIAGGSSGSTAGAPGCSTPERSGR